MRHCANHSLSEYLNTNVSTLLEETLFLTDLLLTYCMANSRKIQQFNNLYTKYLRKLIYLFTLPLEHGEYEIFIYTRNKCMDFLYRTAATCNADVLRGIL